MDKTSRRDYLSITRPLFHPAINDITVEGILHALSDPIRAQIFSEIVEASGPKNCSVFLEVSDRTVPKSTLSQHFKVLREAGLIRSERCGVELHNRPRCEEIQERFGALITAILEAHKAQVERERAAKRRKRAAVAR
jgi:DNA-binding transcriptional ArsR family regulator